VAEDRREPLPADLDHWRASRGWNRLSGVLAVPVRSRLDCRMMATENL
jgi:hypothetical protein